MASANVFIIARPSEVYVVRTLSAILFSMTVSVIAVSALLLVLHQAVRVLGGYGNPPAA